MRIKNTFFLYIAQLLTLVFAAPFRTLVLLAGLVYCHQAVAKNNSVEGNGKPNHVVNAIAEYRCDVKWQLYPKKYRTFKTDINVSPEEHSFLIVEFEKPFDINGSLIFGVGKEGVDKPAASLEAGGNIVLLSKENVGDMEKLNYAELTGSQNLSKVVKLSDSIMSLSGKFKKVGFLIYNGTSPGDSAFQRAPIDADVDQGKYLKPQAANCKKLEKKYKVAPLALE